MEKSRVSNKKKGIGVLIKIAIICLSLLILGALVFLGISEYMRISVADKVFDSVADIPKKEGIDCVLVLGAGLKSDGTPSHMLEDRIKVGVEVMEAIDADYILMSGDRSGEHYDEPAAMKKYAEDLGVDPSKILIDNSGFSTYESITRAEDEYGFDKIVVITQKYHLYRAIYIAEDCGIDAVGVSADLRPYRNQFVREIREVLARVKDFFLCV